MAEETETTSNQSYSVLMSVYRLEEPEHLRQAIESIFSQTLPTDDFVIVLDGPISAALQAVIDDASDEHPGVINQVQLTENVGLGRALNEGLPVCKHELVARMDSDDIAFPQRCEIQVGMFANDPDLSIVGSPTLEFSGDTDNVTGVRDVPKTNDEIRRFARRRDPFNHPTVMYKKSAVLNCGPYRDYRKNQDSALWVDMLSSGCKGANTEEPLLYFRFDEGTYKKRRTFYNTKTLIEIRWDSFRRGFSTLPDFLIVAAAQMVLFVMPGFVPRLMYRAMRGHAR